MDDKQYMKIKDAAAQLDVNVKLVRDWLIQGRIAHLKIPNAKQFTWLVNRADFDRFIKEHFHAAAEKRPAGRPSTIINLRGGRQT